jgi:hypothetical protein
MFFQKFYREQPNAGERLSAIHHASPSEGGRRHKAGATPACIDDACVLDPEACFLESGVELNCRELRRRCRSFIDSQPSHPPGG